MSLLIWLFVIPLLMSLTLFFCTGVSQRFLKGMAIVMSLLPLALLLYGSVTTGWIGSSVSYPWLPSLSIDFSLRVDVLSLLFLVLTAVIIPVSLLSTCSDSFAFPHVFYGFVLLLQGLLMGFFMARDLVVFTIFWEAMLLPLYFIITLWGGAQRQAAAIKFLIYMIAGSALMVAAVLSLYFVALSVNGSGTFHLDNLAKISETAPYAGWMFAIFMLAFAVKTPLFPFHAWLPDAYCQASTAGTILLAGILSKAGIYGIFRIGLELFPTFMKAWSPWLLGFAIVGVFYGGLAAWKQNDYKRLLAYSSFSHVNFILVGLFVWDATAHAGALLQAVNHGITIAALFLVAGWLEARLGSTSIQAGSGLAKYLPHLCWLTLFFVLSSVALPGMNNFVGELMIFFGLFGQNFWLASFLGLTIILSVMYMLRWMQKVYFEEPSSIQSGLVDIKGKELWIALPLMLLILWIGIYPSPILKLLQEL